ncbi:MAG: tyrosine--tRNA ligase [Candidatus Gracilibacteria bacterium]|nr:tyrosine--tRNA ligase [Candidatus Peregrinibacteria bacterium]
MEKPDLNQINNLLSRGTVEVLVKKDLEKKLLSGKKLNIKLGIDPSGADLHIGHMVVIRKLQEFQKLGHNIYLLFGNFTGQIGDPTGKSETRTVKTQEELEANAKHYLDQVKKVLDINNIEVVWNADWLGKLTFADVTKLAAQFTVAQMMERDMFQERVKKNQPISVHEFMYPLMQGYDSVALKADVELGGTDQTFNLLAGRTLQKAYGQTPQDIVTVPILEGTDGNIKMGKSTNNYIGVNEEPKEMYGKIMSIPDKLITRYFELATSVPVDEIKKISDSLEKGENPRDAKMRLAREIVTIYHDEKDAESAEQEFIQVFSKKELPSDIETKRLAEESLNIVELLSRTGLTSSKSEARRLIDGGGVRVDNEKVESQDLILSLEKEKLIQVGKRKFLKVVKET